MSRFSAFTHALTPTSLQPSPAPAPPAAVTLVVDPHGPAPMGVTTTQIAAAAARGDLGRKKRPETLFGPDVGGEEGDEKGWLEGLQEGEGGKVGLEVVRGWVERAKKEEGIHPTTTLQSLVNLLRPTLTLSPSPTSPTHHLLSFSYDSSSPHTLITLTLHPNPASSRRNSTHSSKQEVVQLFQGVRAGGFGVKFTLPEEGQLDLAAAVERTRHSEDGDSSTLSGAEKPTPVSPSAPIPTPSTPAPATPTTSARIRGILPTIMPGFNSRRRQNDLEAQILADVSGNTMGAGGEAIEMTEPGKAGEGEGKAEEGMRVVIRLDGLDEDGQPLPSRNAQLTHILITGTWISAATVMTPGTPAVEEAAAAASDPMDAAAGGAGGEGRRRVWVIKVARREAIIGSHTFLLKEIYGLASSTTPDAPVSTPSYPPTAGALDDPYASTPNECIVCLTSPRDVVLLPCRHLVVCRECAVGMIEFGAGGKVARREEVPEATVTTPTPAQGTEGGEQQQEVEQVQTSVVPQPQTRERRKRKAKGWFCPVCRQPYTSLLRLALPHSDAAHAHGPSRGVSRAPSRAASMHGGASLHRVSSRATIATLPARGEKLLQDIASSHHVATGDGEDDDEVDQVDGQIETDGDRRERLQQEGIDREEREREVREQTGERPQFVLEEEVAEGSEKKKTLEV